ncbi:transposase [Glutamicibacter creatinolyticus]|uniref:transposase n=1 Tax=Glutamicibacter creatinolyticus TaxID=162496 RepID=UPI003B983D02
MPAPRKYDAETQARAVRLYQERIEQGNISQTRVRQEIGELLGINPGTLRNWIRREQGEGLTPAASASQEPANEEVARLRRENAQLRRANEILKTASAFFAAAQLDRKLGQ